MTARKKYPVSFHLKRGCLLLIALLFLHPAGASAEPYLFLSMVEELEDLDLKALKNMKLSAKLRTNDKGKIVFQILNLTMPVDGSAFTGEGNRIRLSQIEIKAVKKGAVARVAFSF